MKWIAKPFLWLVNCAIPVFIAACYGAYYEDGMFGGEHEVRATGKVNSAVTGQGVADIHVSCVRDGADGGLTLDATYSLPGDGAFELWYLEGEPCDTLRFEDLDGLDNDGLFATLEVPFDETLPETVVELEPEE
jgi:hypothetical protein